MIVIKRWQKGVNEMNEQRKGEIALAILKDQLKEDGMRKLDASSIRRSIGNLSERTGISQEELLQFGKIILTDVVAEAFTAKKD